MKEATERTNPVVEPAVEAGTSRTRVRLGRLGRFALVGGSVAVTLGGALVTDPELSSGADSAVLALLVPATGVHAFIAWANTRPRGRHSRRRTRQGRLQRRSHRSTHDRRIIRDGLRHAGGVGVLVVAHLVTPAPWQLLPGFMACVAYVASYRATSALAREPGEAPRSLRRVGQELIAEPLEHYPQLNGVVNAIIGAPARPDGGRSPHALLLVMSGFGVFGVVAYGALGVDPAEVPTTAVADGNATSTPSTAPQVGGDRPPTSAGQHAAESSGTADPGVPTGDLEVTVELGPPADDGRPTLVVTVRNLGAAAVDAASLTFEPALIGDVDVEVSNGQFDPVSGGWTAMGLGAGEVETATVVGGLDRSQTDLLVVGLDVDAIDDSNDANDVAVLALPPTADLAIEIAAVGVDADGRSTFLVIVENRGVVAIDEAHVEIEMPTIGAPTVSPSVGEYDPTTSRWTGLSLAPGGAERTLFVTAMIDPSIADPRLVVRASALNVEDGERGNDHFELPIGPAPVDVSAMLTASAVDENDVATLVLTATHGRGAAVDLLAVTIGGPVLEVVAVLPSAGAFDLTSGQWSGLSLADGAAETLTLTVVVDRDAIADAPVRAHLGAIGVVDTEPSNDEAVVFLQ